MNQLAVVLKKICLISFLLITVFFNWVSTFDSIANEALSDSIYRSSVVFAFAKGLNAAISVVQGTQISITPIGLGFSISIGELLDPINDIVEQFSNLMLVASVALGIQKILILIGNHLIVKWLITFVCTLFFLLLFTKQYAPKNLKKAFILIAMIRFAVPFSVIGGGLLFDTFLEPQYKISKDSIVDRTIEIKDLSNEKDVLPSINQSLYDETKWWELKLPKIPSMDNIRKRIESIENGIKDIAEKTTENIINLLVVFTLQTIVFPIFLLWMLYRILLGLIS